MPTTNHGKQQNLIFGELEDLQSISNIRQYALLNLIAGGGGILLIQYIFQTVMQSEYIHIWTWMVLFILFSHIATCWLLNSHSGLLSIKHWKITLALFSFFSGTAWGSLIFFTPDGTVYTLTMTCIFFALIGASLGVTGHHFSIFASFTAPVFMLLVIHLLQLGGSLFISLAIFSVIYLFATFFIAYKFTKVTRQKKLLDKENETLVQQLKNKKKVAEKANADKSRFLASASHDLRQPLQAMNLFAQALKEQITDPKQHSLLHKLRTSMEETDSLLDSLLDMSKLDAGLVRVNQAKFLLFPILHKLEKEFHLQASNKSLSLSVDTNIKRVDGNTSHITSDEIIIQSDPILLKNILSNLLSNAIKYTQHGQITISCLHSEHGYIVYLKDTGIGIAENERDNVFDAFYQVSNTERSRSKGIGLGLSIVQHLCKLLEHQIIMHSQPEAGTTFEIHIPCATEVSTPHQRHTLLHNLNAIVLVVDDETAILEGMQAMLTPWGCTVITAQSLDETLVLLKKDAAIDLLLVDYRLQHNQVGTTIIHQARKLLNKPDLPAIIISGDTEPKRMQNMEREGFEVLHKPIKPAQLRSLMNHLLK